MTRVSKQFLYCFVVVYVYLEVIFLSLTQKDFKNLYFLIFALKEFQIIVLGYLINFWALNDFK